ncbi:MAG: exodeoxyribonuclease VII large subunit [Chloroflexi bacterium]|nr:exodeoxyribonuclease VII large subunit [Chloroflexota bacterium]
MTDPYSVYDLTTTIRELLEQDERLFDVWVEGEISNFRRHTSGHLYFTLKDDRSELPCVMWKSRAMFLPFDPAHGDAVLAHGRITVYEARGQYQLLCDLLQPAGVGELNRQFELLKARLDAEGLFDSARKREIPLFPQRIGVVTSPSTAAFQDIQNVIRRRYPTVEIVLSPTPVQGRDAPPQIIAALERLNRYGNVDVILLARGGGSLEDLWCFNDEALVRAVAGSRIPVVTGVGHEIDFTLVDFAADQRAPTPSAAAEQITPDGAALGQSVRILARRLDDAMQARIVTRRQALANNARWLERLSPEVRVQNARQRVDDLLARIETHVRHRLDRRRDRLVGQVRALEAANPTALLQRGYALVTRAGDGKRITSAWDAAEQTRVDIALHDGHLIAVVHQRRFNDDSQQGPE